MQHACRVTNNCAILRIECQVIAGQEDKKMILCYVIKRDKKRKYQMSI